MLQITNNNHNIFSVEDINEMEGWNRTITDIKNIVMSAKNLFDDPDPSVSLQYVCGCIP